MSNMIQPGSLDYLMGKRILITGGTGSLGKKLAGIILGQVPDAQVIIYSRDEFKQYQMRELFSREQQGRIRFFLGDVRDLARLKRAMERVTYVIHAAALKQVPASEYNPFEFVKTNVLGAENVINAAIDNDVRNVVALSTDKAANPINLYGATKLCSDKLFITGNSYSGLHPTRFSVVRYGNVVGSRGSVIPYFLKKRKEGKLPVTDLRMTRFWITLEQGALLVLNALRDMCGGEIWVPKIPSMRIRDIAGVIAPECRIEETGIRPGEKLHEVMIPLDDARQSLEFDSYFVIQPNFLWWRKENQIDHDGRPCPDGFYYGSDNSQLLLSDDELERMIAGLDLVEARRWGEERGLKY